MEFSRVYMKDLTDAELSAFWVMMLESGRDEATFYDVPRMAPREFVRWVRGSGVHLWIILFRGEPAGMFWLSDQAGRTAKCHFAMLPMGAKRTAGRMSAQQGFGLYALSCVLHARDVSGRHVLDRCYGITPLANRKAISFIRRVGAQEITVLPGVCWDHTSGENLDGLLTMFTRATVPAACVQL